MKKRYITFRTAAGRTIRFAVKMGRKGVTKGRAWATKQRSKATYTPYHKMSKMSGKVIHTVPKGGKHPINQAPRGKAWQCGSCGKCYTNYVAARNHVRRQNHSHLQMVAL